MPNLDITPDERKALEQAIVDEIAQVKLDIARQIESKNAYKAHLLLVKKDLESLLEKIGRL